MALSSSSVWEVRPTTGEYGGFCTGLQKDLIISVQMEDTSKDDQKQPPTFVEALGAAAAQLGQAQSLLPDRTDTLAISDLDSAQQLIAKIQAKYRDG